MSELFRPSAYDQSDEVMERERETLFYTQLLSLHKFECMLDIMTVSAKRIFY